MRNIESNTDKSARQGNLRHPGLRFQSFADEAREKVQDREISEKKESNTGKRARRKNLRHPRVRFPCLALLPVLDSIYLTRLKIGTVVSH